MDVYIVSGLTIAVVIVSMVLGTKFARERHNSLIEKKINELGGILIISKAKPSLFNESPYKRFNRYDAVYYIEYAVKNEIKEGWVKISRWEDPDWRL